MADIVTNDKSLSWWGSGGWGSGEWKAPIAEPTVIPNVVKAPIAPITTMEMVLDKVTWETISKSEFIKRELDRKTLPIAAVKKTDLYV